ncbi:MAG: GC-type dockerin domain-anchored protein [Planctomycetota bacterium]
MFELQIDANASEGDSITLSFAGAVVLALADDLSTYSTSPGINQQQLGSASLTLTIGGGRLCADVNNDDAVNSSDFFAWVTAFGAEDLVPCDVNSDGSCTSSDFFAWVTFFGNPLADPGNCPPIS